MKTDNKISEKVFQNQFCCRNHWFKTKKTRPRGFLFKKGYLK